MATNYQFKLGDCIFCVLHEHGLMAETVWEHPNNISLKGKRKTPDRLVSGDVVFIPEIRPKEVSEPTNQVHKFRMKTVPHPHWIEIELVGDDNKPIPYEKYKIVLPDGSIKEGNLDEDGWARVEGNPAGQCQVIFPELDKDAWKFIEAASAKSSSS